MLRMGNYDFESMTSDELWELYEEMCAVLANRIGTEKARLEERLRKIKSANRATKPIRRRPYPKVLQKYQNPSNPAETWSGRGKQPRWLKEQLLSGKKLDHFLIGGPSTQDRRGQYEMRLQQRAAKSAKPNVASARASHRAQPLQRKVGGNRRNRRK